MYPTPKMPKWAKAKSACICSIWRIRSAAPKQSFFLLFGFQIGAWAVLADGLRRVVANNEVLEVRATGYGNSYRVCGELLAPDGRRPRVVTIWQIDAGSEVPRLVTAFPEDST